MRAYALLTVVVALAALAVAEPPPIPATPAAIADLVYTRYFTLEQGYAHFWSKERPWTTTGTLLVLSADKALVVPRQVAMPVLFVGDVPAWRLNYGNESGHVIAVVPGKVDLAQLPIWFGAAGFPAELGRRRRPGAAQARR